MDLEKYLSMNTPDTHITTDITVKISEALFRLTTECVRQFSNEQKAYASISQVIDARTRKAVANGRYLDRDMISAHLAAIGSDGPISISLTFEEGSIPLIAELRADVSQIVTRDLSVIDAISVLLFDYIAEQESARLATRLGLRGDEASHYRDMLITHRNNVIKFRRH